MSLKFTSILFALYVLSATSSAQQKRLLQVDFYGDSLSFDTSIPDTAYISASFTEMQIITQGAYFQKWNFHPLLDSLLQYKKARLLDDWIYYQLIRKTSQQIFPKEKNYERYTVLKWFLLMRSGYNSTLKVDHQKLLFYVQTDETVFNLPFYIKNDRQYVCLNYHDYGYFEIRNEKLSEIEMPGGNAGNSFSYRINKIPEGEGNTYIEKELQFPYYENIHYFKIKLNPSIAQMFANYPVVDYAAYFDIPLSRQTYQSLIPALKKHVAKMKEKNGVDFLMRFTRYAFLYETDTENFGRERRLTAEQTILYKYSDCEDRVALFFYLVKEIYALPMIVLAYPNHIAIAVKLKKPAGKTILYKGEKYTVAEATPQQDDLPLGKTLPSLKRTQFEIVYVFSPPKIR